MFVHRLTRCFQSFIAVSCVSLLTLTFSSISLFADSSPPTFESAVALLQTGDLAKAQSAFEARLAQNPESPLDLYNSALVLLRQNEKGAAVAQLRLALGSTPTFHAAKKLMSSILKNISVDEGTLNLVWLIHLGIFWWLPFWVIQLLGITLLYQCCRLIAASFVQKQPLPLTFWIRGFVCGTLLIFVTAEKISSTRTWGTNLKSTPVRLASSISAATLFELSEGQEVLVLARQGEWLQIQTPSDRQGWVQGQTLKLIGADRL